MSDFIQLVYKWYNANRRDLPWRKTQDAYKIWISEIILQQTRVDQGLAYYQKITAMFPDIQSLAAANEEQLLKLWQGLGYYSRARNMHSAARTINTIHHGRFPQTYSEILSLKGVGPYTAAAIASIAFGLPHPVLDGNVYRLLSRYYGISSGIDTAAGKKVFNEIAKKIMSKDDPGFHNQALMEFGALQCTPQSPDCMDCPLSSSCYAFINRSVGQLPVKSKKKSNRQRFLCFYLIEEGDSIWLEKRTGDDIWKNLYQFPVVETSRELSREDAVKVHPPFLSGTNYVLKSISEIRKHILSHQTLHARLIHIEATHFSGETGKYLKAKKEDLHQFAVPRLIEKLAKNLNFNKF